MEIGLIQAALPLLLRGFQTLMAIVMCASLWTGVHALASSLTAPTPEGWSGPASVEAGRSEADYAVIDQRNLFRPQEDPPEPEPAAVEQPIEKTSLDLHLVGTMASSDAALSVAVVQSGPTRALEVVKVGDDVAEKQAKVVRIEPRRVVLDHGGRLEAIELDLDPESGSGGGAARPAARPRSPLARPPGVPGSSLPGAGAREAEMRGRVGELMRRGRGEILQGRRALPTRRQPPRLPTPPRRPAPQLPDND